MAGTVFLAQGPAARLRQRQRPLVWSWNKRWTVFTAAVPVLHPTNKSTMPLLLLNPTYTVNKPLTFYCLSNDFLTRQIDVFRVATTRGRPRPRLPGSCGLAYGLCWKIILALSAPYLVATCLKNLTSDCHYGACIRRLLARVWRDDVFAGHAI